MRLTVTDFDTAAAARDQYQRASSTSPEAESSEPIIGDASVELEVNANGVGSIVMFLRGDKLVALQTSKPDNEEALADLDGLTGLARLVESRLR